MFYDWLNPFYAYIFILFWHEERGRAHRIYWYWLRNQVLDTPCISKPHRPSLDICAAHSGYRCPGTLRLKPMCVSMDPNADPKRETLFMEGPPLFFKVSILKESCQRLGKSLESSMLYTFPHHHGRGQHVSNLLSTQTTSIIVTTLYLSVLHALPMARGHWPPRWLYNFIIHAGLERNRARDILPFYEFNDCKNINYKEKLDQIVGGVY